MPIFSLKVWIGEKNRYVTIHVTQNSGISDDEKWNRKRNIEN